MTQVKFGTRVKANQCRLLHSVSFTAGSGADRPALHLSAKGQCRIRRESAAAVLEPANRAIQLSLTP